MSPTKKITKTAVDQLPLPVPTEDGVATQARYYDASMTGFGIRVTSGGSKAFFVEKRTKAGKLRRITIGRYPGLTVEKARKEAVKLFGRIAEGADPVADKQKTKAHGVTLREAFKDYLAARKELKDRTIRDYRHIVDNYFHDWKGKPLAGISKDMVQRRHEKLGDEHGPAQANQAMRVLRAIFNFGIGKYEDAAGHPLLPENPVKRLSRAKAWYRVDRRRTVIKVHQLPAWYLAVMRLTGERSTSKADVVRDYLLLLLFTGLRRQEGAQLRWEDIDLKAKTLTVPDPKNREPHNLPLSDFLYDLLQRRYEARGDAEYVFPGEGKGGYLIEPRRHMKAVTKASGVEFTLHDLRRTFSTVAESLDISSFTVKRLLNHKLDRQDVTAGYIVLDVERLRKPMQQITDYLLSVVGEKPKGDVVPLPDATKSRGKP